MGHQYAGANTFPADYTIPDDTDPDQAVAFNVAFEALGDRTVYNRDALLAYIANTSPRIKIIPFLASGTYTPDAASRIVAAFAVGCGAGGGGAKGGSSGAAVEERWFSGAGGGGGALIHTVPVTLVPGTLYNIDIGAGGLGATSATGTGGSGGDTILRNGGTNLAAFGGAQGGRGPVGGVVVGLWNNHALGGMPRAGAGSLFIGDSSLGIRYDTTDAMWQISALQIQLPLASGGYGSGGSLLPASCDGQPNPFGIFTGGVAGTAGGDVGGARGGGGGGGGGAGPYGNGGAGGNGFNPAGGGSAPGAAAVNSGAGGGGSGSIAYFSTQTLHNGGAGGSGRLYLITVEESS